jgi:hypothetical protein
MTSLTSPTRWIERTYMLDGDWSLWQDLISHADVTVVGAYGRSARGWSDVCIRFMQTAVGASSYVHAHGRPNARRVEQRGHRPAVL